MRHRLCIFLVLVSASLTTAQDAPADDAGEKGWYSLFNGKDLDGWKCMGPAESFQVKDGVIVAHGKPLAHLYYVGPVAGHDFKNFELLVEAMTKPNSNSGIYFHTEVIDRNYPKKGYEVQINNSYHDPVKTGSIYQVRNVTKPPVADNEWFTVKLTVKGQHVTVQVNDETLIDWTEPEGKQPKPGAYFDRRLSRGTFALQAHDPKSIVHYRTIWVRPLDED